MMFAPIVYVMYLALTIWALAVVMLLAMIPLAIIAPCTVYYLNKSEKISSEKTQELNM